MRFAFIRTAELCWATVLSNKAHRMQMLIVSLPDSCGTESSCRKMSSHISFVSVIPELDDSQFKSVCITDQTIHQYNDNDFEQ